MRKNTIHSFLSRLSVVLAIILSGGCTDEEIMKGTPYVEEGVPVQVSIPFNVKRSSVWTRAAQSETDELRINILYVIAFNEDGSVSGRAVYNDQNNATGKGKIEKFPMTSGKNKKIFIVANPQSGVGTLDIQQLDAVNHIDIFRQLNTQLLEPMNVERNYLMMLGQMKNTSGGEDITVETNGKVLNTEENPVMLERLDAHIRFVIKVDNSEHTDIKFTPRYYAVENIPQGSYLVPRAVNSGAATDKESHLDKNSDGSYYDYTEEMEAKEAGSGYKSMSVGNSTTKYFDEGYLDIKEGDKTVKCPYFEFYLLENRRQYKKKITAAEKQKSKGHGIEDAAHLYALRAKREKNEMDKEDPNKPGKTEENGDLIFANDHSACVRIYGTLEYTDYDDTDKMTKFYTANVTYTVFLGATGNKSENGDTWCDTETLVNDYNTMRNGFYTYTVTLSGVNSMRVEVKVETGDTPKEERPDVEGDVIVAGGEVHSMDAHYGRTLIRLSKKDIKAGLAWAVSTPLCSGMKNIKSELLKPEDEANLENKADLKTNLQLNDYKWVLFAINKEYPFKGHDDGEHNYNSFTDLTHDNHYCRSVLVKFPGYQCYNGGGTDGSTQAPALGGEGYQSSYYNNAKVKLYDVNQLLNRLCLEAQKDDSDIFDNFDKSATDDSKDSVTISVFVDEFVYYYNPTDIYYKSPLETINEADLLLWKNAVNGENRYLHICKAGAKYSPDGNTSWANSVVSISQRPIYTFYNENDTELKSAWGTESIIEAGDAGYPDGELWVYDEEQPVGDGNIAKYQMYDGKDLSTYDNGRLNNIRVLFGRDNGGSNQELHWSDLRSIYTDVGALRKGYRDIWHACLMRNRDLDGDDIVEENEIRWYLASIDQLTDLWIGQYSVPNAKLYDDTRFATTAKVRRYHIASSTFYDNETYKPPIGLNTYKNPYCVWGEEGASIGGWYVQYNWGLSGSHKNTEVQGKNDASPKTGTKHVSYRCVRNLGILLTQRDEVPEDYVSYEHTGKPNEQYGYMEPKIYTRFIDGKTYYECRLNINRMDANSRRAPLGEGGFLLGTNERNFNNRPYNGLALLIEASDNKEGIYEAKNWQDAFKNETTTYPCPRGYRIPNQRELMLLYTTWRGYFRPKNGNPFMCKTSYGYNGTTPYNNGKRYGFAYDGTNMYLIDGDRKFAVRAVRDWTPGTDD